LPWLIKMPWLKQSVLGEREYIIGLKMPWNLALVLVNEKKKEKGL